MIIQKLSVGSFGKLRDFTLQPKEGLNAFVHPNEFGKTTLIYFIYYMLYGYDAKLLKKYLPWSGEELAGSMEFSLQGKTWRIQRRRPAKGMEKRQIICLETGEERILSNREQPGPHFLGLDGETFLRSFCITQGDLLFSRTDGLDVALKNMAATGDENVSYHQAEEYLNKLHTQYRHRTRNAGRLVEQKEQLARGKEREQALRAAVDARLREQQQWEALEEQLNQKEQELKALQQRLAAAEGSDALRLLKQLNALRELPKAEKPAVEKQDLAAMEQAFDEVDRAQAELKLTEEAAASAQKELNELNAIKGGILPMILLIAGALSALLGALVLWVFYLAAGALWLGAMALYLVQSSGRRAARQGVEKNLAAARAEQAKAKQLAEQAGAALEQLRQTHRILTRQELREMQIAWGVYESAAGSDAIALQEQAILAGRSRAELEALAADASETEETAEQVRSILRQQEQQREALRRQKDALDLQDLRLLWEQLSSCEAENIRLKQEISEGEEQLAAIQQSLLWLKDANEEMNTHFAPKLCGAAGAHLAALTAGKYSQLLMDDQFAIRLEAQGGTYPAEAFSAGTRDAVYFAFRLAAGEMLSQEPLPMVLDDPFTNLDPARRAAAETLLEKAGESRQILYFSCRE